MNNYIELNNSNNAMPIQIQCYKCKENVYLKYKFILKKDKIAIVCMGINMSKEYC